MSARDITATHWSSAGRVIAVALILAGTAACGPLVRTQVRMDAEPYSAKEWRQTKDGITVELVAVKALPPEFSAQAQACNEQGQPLVDAQGQPVVETVALVSSDYGENITKVAIANSTQHVLYLNRVVVHTIDPAGNKYDLLSKNQLQALLQSARPCPSTGGLLTRFATVKVFDRANAEVDPGDSWTGYIVTGPVNHDVFFVPGTWKLALYEIPVATDAAGNVTKTTSFDLRTVTKKYLDTYQAANMFSSFELVSTKEADQ